ncbi:MAG: RecX family transcriptional regulator [Bacteroidales bacterium]|nr:RecX family transcriptional regulator [Bacteroidales bacterium]
MQQKHITYQKALNKAMYLCSKAEKCKSDIRKKLYDWKANPDEHDKIIQQLEDQKFIDEERFVKYYVRDKFEFNKWGKIKIRTMLFKKQIPESLIINELKQISEEKYKKTLEYLIKQKQKSIKDTEPYKIKTKLLRFAASKGFEPDLILSILNR